MRKASQPSERRTAAYNICTFTNGARNVDQAGFGPLVPAQLRQGCPDAAAQAWRDRRVVEPTVGLQQACSIVMRTVTPDIPVSWVLRRISSLLP